MRGRSPGGDEMIQRETGMTDAWYWVLGTMAISKDALFKKKKWSLLSLFCFKTVSLSPGLPASLPAMSLKMTLNL